MDSNLLLFWIGTGIIFLILELITSTFYGFALAIASFIVAMYVFFLGADVFDGIQWLIFAIIAVICSYFFPKWLTPKDPINDKPQGLDIYIGQTHKIRQFWEDFKILLDWVQYLIISDDELENKDLVEIVDRRGSLFVVKKVVK